MGKQFRQIQIPRDLVSKSGRCAGRHLKPTPPPSPTHSSIPDMNEQLAVLRTREHPEPRPLLLLLSELTKACLHF